MSSNSLLETMGKRPADAGEDGASETALSSSTIKQGKVMVVDHGRVINDDSGRVRGNHFKGKDEGQ